MTPIVQNGDPVLRAIAKPVAVEEITSPAIKAIIKDMSKALTVCPDGVAIAAPQIGVSLRIFVVSGKVQAMREKTEKNYPDTVYINPTFLKISTKKVTFDEGCLSVRWQYGKIKRAEKVTIEAYNELGEKIQKSASGFLAEIFQHEIDHLDGILFIDKAIDIHEVRPEDHE